MSEKATHDALLGGRDSTENNHDDQLDGVRELLNVVTQETRFSLIQDIVGHPKGMPSLKELDYVNPSKSKSTIRGHLEKLIDYGVVERVELPEDERQRDLPYQFFGLTDFGRDFLEQYDLLRAEETLKEMHSMLEKTPQIEKYVDAPRPGELDDGDQEDESEDRRVVKP